MIASQKDAGQAGRSFLWMKCPQHAIMGYALRYVFSGRTTKPMRILRLPRLTTPDGLTRALAAPRVLSLFSCLQRYSSLFSTTTLLVYFVPHLKALSIANKSHCMPDGVLPVGNLEISVHLFIGLDLLIQ